MYNEILLILSVFFLFTLTLAWYAIFGTKGLMCWTVLATIAANIEVLILVDAFGMSQTLGNVMFASTFLVTDIISEVKNKKTAQKAVNIGIATSISFILVSQSWLLFTPSEFDTSFSAIKSVFSNTPRMMLAGLLVYAIVQRFDVFLYHKWWEFTEKKFNTKKGYLWIRNNGSTLVSQLLNTVLFTFGAFLGKYEIKELVTIAAASYVIFIFTSLMDTPFVYLARLMKEKNFLNCNSD